MARTLFTIMKCGRVENQASTFKNCEDVFLSSFPFSDHPWTFVAKFSVRTVKLESAYRE